MFEWLDSLLLNAAQKFCDKVQRFTGVTKFCLAKWSAILATAFFWYCIAHEPDPFPIFFGLGNSTSTFFIAKRMEEEEAEFLRNGTLEDSPTHFVFVRLTVILVLGPLAIMSLTWLPHGIGQLIFYTAMCTIVSVYFSSCIPRPPSKSTMREWYEKGLWWLNDRLKPASSPATS